MQKKLIIFSAPSGAGKTTIVKHLLKQNDKLGFSVSACSRAKRENETDGKDYCFLTVNDFKNKIKNDEFVEWEEVYKNNFYGTLKSEIERIWANGKTVLFDVDVVGGLNLKNIYGEKALAVFVMPPSLKSLEKRLKQRKTETSESIARRIKKAKEELKTAPQFDVVIKNSDLKKTLIEAEKIVAKFLAKKNSKS